MQALLKKTAWLAYAAAYLLFTVQQELYSPHRSVLLLLMNSILPVAVTFAIYGYAMNKAFMERMIWRVLFWILLLRAFFIAYININAGIISDLHDPYIAQKLFLLLLPFPGLYALYRYSEQDNPLWPQREHREHEKFADELFAKKDVVKGSLNREEGEGISCEASLTRQGSQFELQLRITEAGETREEHHSFSSAMVALEYIEENTPLSMYEME